MSSLLQVLPEDSTPESTGAGVGGGGGSLLLALCSFDIQLEKINCGCAHPSLVCQLLPERACLGCQILNKYLWKVNAQDSAALGDV